MGLEKVNTAEIREQIQHKNDQKDRGRHIHALRGHRKAKGYVKIQQTAQQQQTGASRGECPHYAAHDADERA
jgi:hypothetical protein